jgi:rod shape-determining protein MreB
LGGGVVLSEPTVCAVSTDNKNEVKAIGNEAKKLIGKTAKNTKTVFPVFEGEIVNEKVASGMLKEFLNKINVRGSLLGVHAVMAVPCGVNGEMLTKYKKVLKSCGISKVDFVEAPLLSALGQRIPLNDSTPCFIVDMAGGTTNIAAVSLDGVIAGISVNFGANKINADIIDHIADVYGLQIGYLTAERLKNEIGSLDKNDGLATVVNGRDLKTGAPRAVSIKAMDVFEPVTKYFDKIAELAVSVLKKLPPEVSAEIRHAGVYVSGIASSIYGLEKYYSDKFGMQINVADNGMMSVVLGGGVVIGNKDLLKKLAIVVK